MHCSDSYMPNGIEGYDNYYVNPRPDGIQEKDIFSVRSRLNAFPQSNYYTSSALFNNRRKEKLDKSTRGRVFTNRHEDYDYQEEPCPRDHVKYGVQNPQHFHPDNEYSPIEYGFRGRDNSGYDSDYEHYRELKHKYEQSVQLNDLDTKINYVYILLIIIIVIHVIMIVLITPIVLAKINKISR